METPVHQRVQQLHEHGKIHVTVTLEEIRAEVKRLDPNLEEEDPAFVAAVCMLSALEVGAYAVRVEKFTGYTYRRVTTIARRLTESGVWRGGKTHHSGWDDKDTGGIAFWSDVCVATGKLKRGIRARPDNRLGRQA